MPTGIYDHSLRRGFKHSPESILKIKLARAKQVGDKHPNWKGGKIIRDGYIYLKVDHPMAGKQGYYAEHRLVLEKSLNRYLLKTETIHHINGIKSDNRLENLELYSSRGQHTILRHPEVALKSSLANKGIRRSPKTEFKKGQIPWNKTI